MKNAVSRSYQRRATIICRTKQTIAISAWSIAIQERGSFPLMRGMKTRIRDSVNSMSEESCEERLQYLIATAERPGLRGCSDHAVQVLEKRAFQIWNMGGGWYGGRALVSGSPLDLVPRLRNHISNRKASSRGRRRV